MLVKDMPEATCGRLMTVTGATKLIEAARLLCSGSDVVVVCGGDGSLQGVLTKTDVVRQISTCQGNACHVRVEAVMTSDVVLCLESDHLKDVSERMKARHLKNIPVVDVKRRPSGLLNARAVLRVLLGDAEQEEAQIIDYVKGVGYQ